MQHTPDDWRLLNRELTARKEIRASLAGWATEALAPLGFEPARHHRYLMSQLEALTRGDIDRLMVLMPPGSAKSTYASILYPAWWFTQEPRSSVLAVSHTSRLAERFSRRVREMIAIHHGQLGFELEKGERSSSSWRTSTGGEYLAAGIRGGISGRRADLVIIDDPVKSQLEADSATHRDFIWQWYRSDLTTRLRPKARIVLVMTRWHQDDLGGRLLEHCANEWKIVRLPALAEADDPVGRGVGEPLWPEWENTDALNRKRSLVGERTWAALFQQTPYPVTGSLFRPDCLTIVDSVATGPAATVVRAWDLAATSAGTGTNPDWTVGLKLHRDQANRLTVLDVVRMRGSPRQVEDAILATARLDGQAVWIGLPEDPGQAGKSQITYLAGRLAGFRLITSRETGSKAVRALPLASQIEAGNVALFRADWNQRLIEELRDFPLGRKDDQVDAFVRAFQSLGRAAETIHIAGIPLLAR
jgi:predicted phage terminase large subunit-like protein